MDLWTLKAFLLFSMSILLLGFSSSADVSLEEGWNQISASESFEASELSSKCDLDSIGGYEVWGFSNGSWTHPNVLSSNMGYFVKSQSSCNISIEAVEGHNPRNVLPGWTMVSNGKTGEWICEDQKAWNYRGSNWNSVNRLSEMNENEGYWVNLEDRCELKVVQNPYPSSRSIPGNIEAEFFDTGGQGISYNDTTPGNENHFKLRNTNVEAREQEGEDDKVVGVVKEGEWYEYSFSSDSGEYMIEAKASSGIGDRKFSVRIDDKKIGEANIPNTGWSNFRVFEIGTVNLDSGSHVMRVEAIDGGTDFDSFRIINETSEDSDESTNDSVDNQDDSIHFRNEVKRLLTNSKGTDMVPGEANLKDYLSSLSQGSRDYYSSDVEYRIIKLPEGAVYTPKEPILLRRGYQLHAYGATIKPQHDGPVFKIDRESNIYGGTIDLGSTGATAFKWNDMRNRHTPGIRGTKIISEPGTGSVGLRVDGDRWFWVFNTPYFSTSGVDYPIIFRSTDKEHRNWYNSNDVFVEAENYLKGVQIKGDTRFNGNRIGLNLTPTSRSKKAVEVDNEKALNIFTEGNVRVPESHDTLFDLIEYEDSRRAVDIQHNSYNGDVYDEPPMWEDYQNDETNNMIDFSGASLEDSVNIENSVESLPDKRVLLADGSDFQQTLNEAAANDKHVRIESGTQLKVSEVFVPAGVIVDARGATFNIKDIPDSAEYGLKFGNGALLIGGRIFTGFEGTALLIEADGETIDQPTGPVWTRTRRPWWGLDSRNTRMMTIRAENNGEIRGLKNSANSWRVTRGIVIEADSSSNIKNNDLYLNPGGGKYLLQMRGEGKIANNRIRGQFQPDDGHTINGLVIDGPRIKDNIISISDWDHHRAAEEFASFQETGGDNSLVSYLTSDPEIDNKWNNFDYDSSKDNILSYTDFNEYPEVKEVAMRNRLFPHEFLPTSLEE